MMISYTTRFTPFTSLMMRVESRASSSAGRRVQSAVMPSTRLDDADREHVLVGALIAHDADGLHRQEDGEGLPDAVVPAGGADLLLDDGVGGLHDGDALGGDLAEDADGQAGAGEGMAADDGRRDAEDGPSSRTSSLKSSRSGSTSSRRMRSGRPPTLWWLLMVADGPLNDTDSMTSG